MNDLESSLSAMFTDRATDVTHPPALADPGKDASNHSRSRNMTPLAAAAAVVVVAGGAVVGAGLAHRHHGSSGPAAPRATSTVVAAAARSCPMPASWQHAIDVGRIPVDQPQNTPISLGANGSVLMVQSNGSKHDEIAVFDQANHGVTIWKSADPTHLQAVAGPNSMNTDWVVFGVTGTQNLGIPHVLYAYDRSTGKLRTIESVDVAKNVMLSDPIVVDDTVEWIQGTFSHGDTNRIIGQNLRSGARTFNIAAPKATRLLPIDGGAIWVADTGDAYVPALTSAAHLVGSPAVPVPTAVSASSRAGRSYAVNGSTVTWVRGTGANARVYSWTVAAPTASSRAVPALSTFNQGEAFPFGTWFYMPVVNTSQSAPLVSATEQVVMQAGVGIVLTNGTQALMVEPSSSSASNNVSRVPLSALSPVRC
jgi:hypothetical protein